MPVSGPVVHRQLMDALNFQNQRYEQDRLQLSDAKQQRDDIDRRRSEGLVDLAQFYLPELTQEAISQTWSEVRGSIAAVLQRQTEDVARIAARFRSANEQRQQSESRLMTVNEQLDELIERQGELSDVAEQRLRGDEAFVELSGQAARAEAALERAEANLDEIEQDSARKLPAYQQSKLFTYLRDRGFGTEAYTHRGFTRRMDRALARFIKYRDAKRGYDFLKDTPDRMRKIIADDRSALDTVMSELERRRDRAAEATGLSETVAKVGEQMRTRQSLVDEIDRLLNETEQAQKDLSTAQDTRGPHYHEAIGIFRDMLARIDSGELGRRARRTVDLTDDQIVAKLEGAQDEMEEIEDHARRRKSDLERRQRLLQEFGQVIQRFRSAGFDSARSQFVGTLDVPSEVNRAMASESMEPLWNSIRSAQRWGPSAMDQLTDVATHPLTQVLLNAAAHAAGSAMRGEIRRAGRRRGGFGRRRGSTWGPWGDSSW